MGNGRVIPAGPLRAPLRDQVRLADAVLSVGQGDADIDVVRAAARAGKPVMRAALKPSGASDMLGKRVLAFCGIGDPDKFFSTAANAGCDLVARRAFGDHHMYTETDAQALMAAADADGLELVTTEKDAVRLSHSTGPLAQLRERTRVLAVEMVFETAGDPDALVAATLQRYDARRIGLD